MLMPSAFYFEEIRMIVRDKEKGGWVYKDASLSQLGQLWDSGLDIPDASSSKPSSPYRQVALVYTCVNKIITAIAGLPLVLSTIDEKIVESGPAYNLLFNNPQTSFMAFITQTVGHYTLSRDVFWVFTDFDSNNQPKEIMVVSGTQMHPITRNRRASGELIGWEFRGSNGERAEFALDEVYQWKNFNPYDKFHGLGPVQACQLNINYGYAADLYNSSALANGAEPGQFLQCPASPMMTRSGCSETSSIRVTRVQARPNEPSF